MKRSVIVLMLFLLAGAIGAGWYANEVGRAKDEATATVNTYIDAVKVGNIEEAMRLSRDKRFPDEKARRDAYQSLFTDSPLQSAEITTLERVDNTQMTATLSIKGKNTEPHTVTMPVIKDEETKQWKILLDKMVIQPAAPATPAK